jgi:hypothetical protein
MLFINAETILFKTKTINGKIQKIIDFVYIIFTKFDVYIYLPR